MYLSINNKDYYTVHINNQIYYFESLEKYIRDKRLLRKIKPNTLKSILSTLKTFIYWAMANPSKEEDDLYLYLAQFLEDEENGFEIYNSTFVEELNETVEYLEIKVKPKQPSTIDKDKAIIEDYLKSTDQELFKSFNLEKNIRSYNHQRKYSIHDGYGLKMGKMAQEAFLGDASMIKNDDGTKEDIKAFPYQLYDALLEIAKPRERLLYLLTGACSARASQALNLTLYDFDYDNKKVWLIDPRSNNQLGIHGKGQKNFLKSAYDINASKDKPHVNIGFKAPIPLRYKSRQPLFWISRSYRNLFFETLPEYKFMPESSRQPRHPFFFITSSGARLVPQQAHETFRSHCNTLKKKFPKYANQLDGIGLHSLRHMFGSIMATIQAKMVINKKALKYDIPSDQFKIITKEAMGHKSLQSTNTYFNRPWNIDIELGEHLNEVFESLMTTMSFEEMEERYEIKRLAS